MINSPLKGTTQKSNKLDEEDLITTHHNMMVVYGWIPVEEFRNIPLPTMFCLAKRANDEIAKRENFRLMTLKYYGVKNPK